MILWSIGCSFSTRSKKWPCCTRKWWPRRNTPATIGRRWQRCRRNWRRSLTTSRRWRSTWPWLPASGRLWPRALPQSDAPLRANRAVWRRTRPPVPFRSTPPRWIDVSFFRRPPPPVTSERLAVPCFNLSAASPRLLISYNLLPWLLRILKCERYDFVD